MSECPNCGAPKDLHMVDDDFDPQAIHNKEWCEYAASLRSKLRNMEHVTQTLHSQRLSGKLGAEGTAILEMLGGFDRVFEMVDAATRSLLAELMRDARESSGYTASDYRMKCYTLRYYV